MTAQLSVFLKAPRLGFVKRRLAEEIEPLHAVRLYRIMAARALRTLRDTGLPATVWYAPAAALLEMRRWVGEEWDLRPQASGDAGSRLAAAARSARAGAVWICIAGDCPELTPGIVREACELLVDHEVVLGPSYDGGYYLIGGRAPLPDLFSRMPWSTDRLLEATRHRLEVSRITYAELVPLRNVATAADARAMGLLT